MLNVYFIRHAESIGNVNSHLIGGRSNHLLLSPEGYTQAELLAKRLVYEKIKFDEVYASTAERTIQTALIACKPMGFSLDNIVLSEQLLELDQGEWEGKVRADTYTPERIAMMDADHMGFRAPNGESWRDVEKRMQSFLDSLLFAGVDREKKIGVFSHGMAIRCMLHCLMDFSPALTYRMQTDNTSITQLTYDKHGWVPVRINDAAHLYVPMQDPHSNI